MAKVFGVHELELKAGVRGEDFEQFFQDKVVPLQLPPGWKNYLLKGDRGGREGKYLLLVEIESLEARNQFAPAPDELSAEGQRWVGANQPMYEEWARLASLPGAPTVYTDYVLIAG